MISFTHTRSLARSLSLTNAHASTYFVTYKIYTGTSPILIKNFFSNELNGWKFCTGCQNGCTWGSVPWFKVVAYPNGAVRSYASPSVSAPTTGPRRSRVRARGRVPATGSPRARRTNAPRAQKTKPKTRGNDEDLSPQRPRDGKGVRRRERTGVFTLIMTV